MPSGTAPSTWGPDGRRAAVSITFDNLGEAAEIEQGLWPADRPVGTHPSVTAGLPWILRLLDELGLRATFFVEGVNVEAYPEALTSIPEAGHEIAYHAWRHETWSGLGPGRERQNLERGLKAFDGLDIRPHGFRPPGGRLADSSFELLGELGFRYCSPEGGSADVTDGIATLPFQWPLIDAYYFYEPFGYLREAHGDARDPLPASLMRERLLSALATVARDGGHLCLLFHPFLSVEEEHRGVISDVLEAVRRLTEAGTVWCATCGGVAEHLLLRGERSRPVGE